jgi:hypothetical protein
MAQALLELHHNLKLDPFFVFGSQNNYTIFSYIYAFFIKILGLNKATIVLLIIGQVAFLSSVFYLLRKFLSFNLIVLGIMALAILPPWYGGYHIFSYGEAFLTARTFAEVLSILAIAFALDKKWVLSIIILIFSALMHPLIALPAIAIVWVFFSIEYRTIGLSLAVFGFFVFVLGAFLGIRPFNKILLFYDSKWWDLVKLRNPFCLIVKWKPLNWLNLAIDVVSALLIIKLTDNKTLKQLFLITLSVTISAILISLIGGDLLKDVFIESIQLWRSQLFLHLFAVAFFPYLVITLFRSKKIFYQISAVVLIAVSLWRIENDYTSLVEGGLFVLFLIALHFKNLEIENLKNLFNRKNIFWALAIFSFIACERFIWLFEISFYPISVNFFNLYCLVREIYFVGVLSLAYFFLKKEQIKNYILGLIAIVVIIITVFVFRGVSFDTFNNFLHFDQNPYFLNSAFVLFLVGASFILFSIQNKFTRVFASILIVGLFVLSIIGWDKRSQLDKYFEINTTHNPFYTLIPKNSQVYFLFGTPKPVWMLFERPCFFAEQQVSGDLFNRKSSMLIEKRRLLVMSVKNNIPRLCLMDKNLGYIVSYSRFNNYKPLSTWHINKINTLYLYDCKNIRK